MVRQLTMKYFASDCVVAHINDAFIMFLTDAANTGPCSSSTWVQAKKSFDRVGDTRSLRKLHRISLMAEVKMSPITTEHFQALSISTWSLAQVKLLW